MVEVVFRYFHVLPGQSHKTQDSRSRDPDSNRIPPEWKWSSLTMCLIARLWMDFCVDFVTFYECHTQLPVPKRFNTCICHFLHLTLTLQLMCILGWQLVVSCNMCESEFLHTHTHTHTHTQTHTHTHVRAHRVYPGSNDIGLCDTSSIAPDVLPVNLIIFI